MSAAAEPAIARPTAEAIYSPRSILEPTIAGHNASWDAANFFYKPRWDYDLLAAHSAGLIVGSGCLGGPVAGPLIRGDMDTARTNLARLRDIFGEANLFVEVMDHDIPAERKVIPGLVDLAREFNLPLVATNDSHYAGACDAPTRPGLDHQHHRAGHCRYDELR